MNSLMKKSLYIFFACFLTLFICACSGSTESSEATSNPATDNEGAKEIEVEVNNSFIEEGRFTVNVGTLYQSIDKHIKNTNNNCNGYEITEYGLSSNWASEGDDDIKSFVIFYKGSNKQVGIDEVYDENEVPDGVEISFDIYKYGDSFNNLMENSTQAAMLYMRAIGFTEDDISDQELHQLLFYNIDSSVGFSRDSDNVGDSEGASGNVSIRARTVAHGDNNRSISLYIDPIISDADISQRDTIYFGKYEQDDDDSNGKEEIEWTILDKQDDKVLLLSKKALDYRSYHPEEYDDVTWEECHLRKWLNDDFISEAFSDDEKKQICETVLTTEDNSEYHTSGGNDTSDKVFVLSNEELKKYFPYEETRCCEATEYVIGKGCKVNDEKIVFWLLRTPGDKQYTVQGIETDGYCASYGTRVNEKNAIRPALWAKLEP